MSTAAPLQKTVAQSSPVGNLSHAELLVQHKCACGGSASSSLTGECDTCKNKHLQTKLSMGASNDPLEQEADRVADQVMAMSPTRGATGTPPLIQRVLEQSSSYAGAAPPSVDRVLASSGRPLDLALQQDMGRRFGHDFSHVRVHTGAQAEQSARDVNAHAYTVGPNIVFGAGQFAPDSPDGRRLIAHELTHVVQQLYSSGRNVAHKNGNGLCSPFDHHTTLRTDNATPLQKVTKGSPSLGSAVQCLNSVYEKSKDVTKAFIEATCNYWKKVSNPYYDSFGHCWIACSGSRRCGKGWTRLLGWVYENILKGPHESRRQDLANQKLGIRLSQERGDCASLCEDAVWKGQIDLSAPVIEEWECSTHKLIKHGAGVNVWLQRTAVQRKNGKPEDGKKTNDKKGPTRIYEHRRQGFLITRYSVQGIDFRVGVLESMIGTIERNLDAIATAIIAGNSHVADPSLKIKTCVVSPDYNSSYVTYKGKPAIILLAKEANAETAKHEMGHAIFEEWRTSRDARTATKDVARTLAHIFLRLQKTENVTDNERSTSGTVRKETHPAGLWIADPSQWHKTLASEHPWWNADELFASARKAYLYDDGKSLRTAIAKLAGRDPKVKAPALELLAVLSQLKAGRIPKTPKLPPEAAKGAEEHLVNINPPTEIEGMLLNKGKEHLKWALKPESMQEPGPF